MRYAFVIASAVAMTVAGYGSAAATRPLTFTRAGGAPIVFSGKTYVWCGPWEPDVHVPAVHILLVPKQRRTSYWHLSGVVRDVKRQTRVRFPFGFVWNNVWIVEKSHLEFLREERLHKLIELRLQ